MNTLYDILKGRVILSHNEERHAICTWNGSLTLQVWEERPANGREDGFSQWQEREARTLQSVPVSHSDAYRVADDFLDFVLGIRKE